MLDAPIGTLRKQSGNLSHRHEQPSGACGERSKAEALIKACRLVVFDIGDKRVRGDLVAQGATEGVEKHEFTMTLPLMTSIDR
jgi:hypothetical protein